MAEHSMDAYSLRLCGILCHGRNHFVLGSDRGGKDNAGIAGAQCLTCMERGVSELYLGETSKRDADRLTKRGGQNLPTFSSDCFLVKQDSRSAGEGRNEGGLWSLKW